MKRLSDTGGYAQIATTTPAQTPVAWSSFATGTNPGGHGIFDFLCRDTKTYLPNLALNRYEQKNMFLPPKAVNMRRGTPLWEYLSAHGIGSTVLRCPCTYPPEKLNGQLLSGMGVPDLRGGLGTGTFYSSLADDKPRESENLVRIRFAERGLINTHIIGPRDPKTGDDLRLEMAIQCDSSARQIIIRSAGTPGLLEVREGCWSDWLRVKFKQGLLQSVRGILRFHLVSMEPEFQLYASPVNFDPDFPLFPISSPHGFAGELAWRIGHYHTTGMVEDHTGLNNERISEEAFLDQCETVWREREAMMLHGLEQFDSGFFYCLYDTPDRIQHMFWRFREPDHPSNRGKPPRGEFARVVEDCYRRCDSIIGKVLPFVNDETLFITLSDHGFNGFRRGVNLNTWLHDHGFLALKHGFRPGEEAGDLLRHVDWKKTKAYALGLSGIYLNLRDREQHGIVTHDESPLVKSAIAEGLTGLRDHERASGIAIRSVPTREQVYQGPFLEEAPDLLVNFASGYRVSWASSMGGIPDGHFEDNVKKWSGDHIVDPELVPGVLFMNHVFQTSGARLIDLAPTIMEALGVPKAPSMEGGSLLP